MSKLYLVRHGETDWNLERRYQGSIDIPLNETGRAQARHVSSLLKTIPFVAAYSSPLIRAQETAQLILEGRSLDLQIRPTLKELSFGPLEGKLLEETHQEYADRFSQRQTLGNQEKLAFKIDPAVESGEEALKRALPTLLEIGKTHEGSDVLIVTHGGIIHSLLVHLTDHDWNSFRVENGQIILFAYREGTLFPKTI